MGHYLFSIGGVYIVCFIHSLFYTIIIPEREPREEQKKAGPHTTQHGHTTQNYITTQMIFILLFLMLCLFKHKAYTQHYYKYESQFSNLTTHMLHPCYTCHIKPLSLTSFFFISIHPSHKSNNK